MSKVGKFLIARPTIATGFFSKSIIYLYEHSSHGDTGLVINKRSGLDFSQIAQQRGLEYPYGITPIFKGGPINESSVLLVHTDDFSSQNTLHTGKGLDISSDEVMIQKIVDGNTPRYYRICAGASVWAPGQLDFEIAKNYWLVADLDYAVVFDQMGDDQWESVIDYIGQQFVHRHF